MTATPMFECPRCKYLFEILGFPMTCPDCLGLWTQEDYDYFSGSVDGLPEEDVADILRDDTEEPECFYDHEFGYPTWCPRCRKWFNSMETPCPVCLDCNWPGEESVEQQEEHARQDEIHLKRYGW